MPDVALAAWATSVNKVDKTSALKQFVFYGRRQKIHKNPSNKQSV